MKKLSLVLLLVLGLGVMSAGMVQADPIVVGNPLWYSFLFGPAAPPSDAVGAFYANSDNPGAPPWTYTAATTTSVKITDSFTVGDIFNLYDNSVFVGTTSNVPNNGNFANDLGDAAYANPIFSHGLVHLSCGAPLAHHPNLSKCHR